jgi:hypothetical protein
MMGNTALCATVVLSAIGLASTRVTTTRVYPLPAAILRPLSFCLGLGPRTRQSRLTEVRTGTNIFDVGHQSFADARRWQNEAAIRINICALVHNATRYDGKVVRLRAIHEAGIDTSRLYDSKCKKLWIRDRCPPAPNSCWKIYKPIRKAHNASRKFRRSVLVDVIGRFQAHSREGALSKESEMHSLEILRVRSAKPGRSRSGT